MNPTVRICFRKDLSSIVRLFLSIITFTALTFACGGGPGGGGGGDTTPPTISSTIPLDGAADVDNNSANTLTIIFSESVVVGTGNIVIRNGGDNSVYDTIEPASISGGGTATIVATLNKTLLGVSDYYVQIDATLFADASTNAFAGIGDATSWNFTTLADGAGPVLQSTNPADEAADVSSSLPSLRLTFNEDVTVNPGAVNLIIYNEGGSVFSSIAPASLTGSGTKTITAPFIEVLVGGNNYYVNYPADLFQDAVPNNTTAITDTTTWNFTAVADAAAPVLQSTTPADEAADITQAATSLTMTFDEPVMKNAGNVTIYRADTSQFAQIAAASLAVDNATVTVPVGTTFEENTSYYVQVDSGLIQDKALNSWTGISDNTTWNFTVVADTTAPTLSSVTPLDNATGVAEAITTLTMVFSEDIAVDAAGSNLVIRNMGDDSEFDSFTPAELPVSGGNTVTITLHNSMLEAHSYYVEVPADLIYDTATTPNYFTGLSGNAAWNFQIFVDTTAPALAAVNPLSPADDATGVALSTTSLSITFDDTVYIGTGDITIYNEGGSVFETVPAANLTGDGTATITIPFTGSLTTVTPSYYVNIPGTLLHDDATTPNYYTGIADTTSWSFSVRPAVPGITGLDSADDTYGAGTTGTNADGITYNTTNLTIVGTSDPNVGINLYVGGSPAGSTTADGTGAWSADIDRTEGVYAITATATATGYESSASSPYSLTVDTTLTEIPAVASATRVVVLATASLTTASIYTAESGAVATYTGAANPYTVTVVDIAGNSFSRDQVYTTAAGLKTAVEGATGTATVYIAEDGTYAIGGGPANYIDYTADAVVTVKGISTDVIVTYNTNNDNRAVFHVNSPGSLYLDTLSVAFTRSGKTGITCIGNIAVTASGNLYLRNLRMDSSHLSGTMFVDQTTTGQVWTWNGGGYTQITVSGGGWTVTGSRYQFTATLGATYWQ